MDWERNCIRLCAGILALSAVLRLGSSGFFAPVGQLLGTPEAASLFLYLHTGRVARTTPPDPPRNSPAPTGIRQEAMDAAIPSFSPQEAQNIPVTYNCSYDPDLGALLDAPLEWDLTREAPAVLILHTHGTEAYTPDAQSGYDPSGAYRTLDDQYNMLSLGELVARRLEEAGISVLQDRDLHDYPDYNSAYTNAAASTQAILEQYPSIRFVLDLHRDAADTAYGQMVTECSIGSERAAQLMIVVGTNAGGLDHPEWEQNLSLALKLQTLLERENPGICRPLNLTYHRYNQHLGDRALLIEIGAAGNTLQEAELAAEALAQAIISLKHGTS